MLAKQFDVSFSLPHLLSDLTRFIRAIFRCSCVSVDSCNIISLRNLRSHRSEKVQLRFLLFLLLRLHFFFIDQSLVSDFAELFQDLINVKALLHNVLKVAEHGLLAFVKHQDLINLPQELELVSH